MTVSAFFEVKIATALQGLENIKVFDDQRTNVFLETLYVKTEFAPALGNLCSLWLSGLF